MQFEVIVLSRVDTYRIFFPQLHVKSKKSSIIYYVPAFFRKLGVYHGALLYLHLQSEYQTLKHRESNGNF